MGRKKTKFKGIGGKRSTEYFFDYSLLFVVLFLLGFGLVMVYSASSYNASISELFQYDAAYFLKKQAIADVVGIVAMFIAAFIPYSFWEKFALWAYLGSLVLIIMVKSSWGRSANGATRWLNVFGLSVQPAEIAKLAVILILTTLICKMGATIRTAKGFWFVIGIPVVPSLMVWKITDNMSSAIIIMGIGLLMFFIASPETKKFYLIGAVIVLIGAAIVFCLTAVDVEILKNILEKIIGEFRTKRIMAWVRPEEYASETGFQTLQSLYAIGSGGIFGKGIGQSMQKMGYLPEVQNDMIFALICEELGIFGGICVLILFALLIWRCTVIASNASDLFGSLLTVGVLGHIAIQVILNICVVTNTIPNTGISLPFISCGGTSVVFLLAEMGLVLSVGRGIRLKESS